MSEDTVGGFIGDPAEAFNPPASSGCCGAPAQSSEQPPKASSCCGSVAVEEKPKAPSTGCCG